MKRHYNKLTNNNFDVLVIGGGIYGAWVAYDASLRGLNVAIIEKEDWASGTSSSSSKLVHGGLRYLEHLNFSLVKKSLQERKTLHTIAPHQVRKMHFMIPLYKKGPINKWKIKIGLWIYNFFAKDKENLKKVFNKEESKKKYTFLEDRSLEDIFHYHDYQIDDARLTLEVIEASIQNGAVACNYIKALEFLYKGNEVVGTLAENKLDNEQFKINSKITINTTGQWLQQTYPPIKDKIIISKGIHLVFPTLNTTEAMLIFNEDDRRVFFIIPWYGRTMVGTTDTIYNQSVDKIIIEQEDIDYLLKAVNKVLKTNWQQKDIKGQFAGLRVMQASKQKDIGKITRDWKIISPKKGLIISIGGKISSARQDASKLTDKVCKILKKNQPSQTAHQLTPQAPLNYDKFYQFSLQEGTKINLDSHIISQLISRFGTNIEEIFSLIKEDAILAERIVPELNFCQAEIIYCLKHEMCHNIIDLLRRRIPLLILTPFDDQLIEKIFKLISQYKFWSTEKIKEQTDLLQKQLSK